MKRTTLINIHLTLSSFFLPFLLMMPLTGVLYLAGQKGEVVKELVYTINEKMPSDSLERENFLKEQFLRFDQDYKYEYIRSSGSTHIMRPTSRDFYTVIETEEGIEVYKSRPNLLSKLIELHKGHGPGIFRVLEVFFGFALLLIVISGLCLTLSVKTYRKKGLISLALGILVFGAALII